MSDSVFKYVPVDPGFQPTIGNAQRAERLLRSLFPAAEVRSVSNPDVTFIDSGENDFGVRCPDCGADLGQWWGGAMDLAARTRFAKLEVSLPCCGRLTSLNDLRYGWPAAFGRFVLEVGNLDEDGLSPLQIQTLARELGCLLRELAFEV